MIKTIRGMLGLTGISMRGLRQRKVRTMLTIMGVMIGVAALISASITDETAQRSISDTYGGAAGVADLIVTNATASITDTVGFDAGTLDKVSETPGVELAAPLMQLTTSSSQELEDWEYFYNFSLINGTLLYGIDPELSAEIGHYKLTSGEDLSEDSGNEALVSSSYADSLGIGLGDTLQLAIPGGMADFQVVGLIDSHGLARLNQGKVVLANIVTVAEITGRTGKLDQIDVMAGPDISRDQLIVDLESVLGSAYSVTYPEIKGEQANDVAALMTQSLGFMALLVIAIGVFLIYNTFATTIAERSYEMGMMRAIGAGRSHLMGIILGEACLLGLVGTLLGIPLGIGLARGLGEIIEETTRNQMNDLTILPEHLVMAFIAGVGISLIASLVPAIQSGRLSPLQALTKNRSASRAKSLKLILLGMIILVFSLSIAVYHLFSSSDISFTTAFGVFLLCITGVVLVLSQAIPPLERLLSRVMIITGIYGEIGGRNLGRRPVRTALTAGVLVIGIATVILSGSTGEAYKQYSGDYMDKIAGSDLMIFSPQPFPQEIIDDIETMPGVEKATGIGFIPAKMVDPGGSGEIDGFFIASDPSVHDGSAWDFELLEYAGSREEAVSRMESGSAVFIESYTAVRYGLGVGDMVTLGTLEGRQDFEIVGITFGLQFTGFVVEGGWGDALEYFGTTESSYAKVIVSPGYDISEVGSDISERWGESYHLKVETYTDWYDGMMNEIDEANSISTSMQWIGIVITALAIINTLMMSVWERRRELAMLRAVGMTRRQLIGTITGEALGLGILGGVIGIGLGLLFLPAMTDAFASLTELGTDLPVTLQVQSIFLAVVLALIIPLGAGLIPAWKGANTNIAEAMRSE